MKATKTSPVSPQLVKKEKKKDKKTKAPLENVGEPGDRDRDTKKKNINMEVVSEWWRPL